MAVSSWQIHSKFLGSKRKFGLLYDLSTSCQSSEPRLFVLGLFSPQLPVTDETLLGNDANWLSGDVAPTGLLPTARCPISIFSIPSSAPGLELGQLVPPAEFAGALGSGFETESLRMGLTEIEASSSRCFHGPRPIPLSEEGHQAVLEEGPGVIIETLPEGLF